MVNKLRLGDLLVQDGLIRDSDLRTMLAQQKQHGGRLGEHLVRVNLCTEEQIAHALARQMNIPYTDLADPPPPAMSKLIPRDKAMKLQILAVGNNPFATRVGVAVGDPTDTKTIMEAEKVVGRPIQVHVAPALALRRAIEAAYLSVDLRDEGTSEFQVTDVRGGSRSIKVARAAQSDENPVLSDADLEPLPDAAIEDDEPPAPTPMRRVAPAPPVGAGSESGEEALRMVWAMADLLIERGYFSRAELMKKLRQ
ncbi:MAG TPA: hypothetical protein VLW85_08370 [Myxococcales bacterium]|nr:hypothetical protein [Myxococcales bacterium]